MRKILALAVLLAVLLTGCTVDETLSAYNWVVERLGAFGLSSDFRLGGERRHGADSYTGSYCADYENFSGTEVPFGGTSIRRAAGEELKVDCELTVERGAVKVFWLAGSAEPKVLLEAQGSYHGTLTLPSGGNYLGVYCNGLTGRLEMNVE